MWLNSFSSLIFCVFLVSVAANVLEHTSDNSKTFLDPFQNLFWWYGDSASYEKVKREKEEILISHKQIVAKELETPDQSKEQSAYEIIKNAFKEMESKKSDEQRDKLIKKLIEMIKNKYQTKLNKLLLQESMLCKTNDQADDFDSLNNVRPKLKYGDMIEFKRQGYSHFSIYIDNDQLLQFENVLFNNITMKNVFNFFPSATIINKIDKTAHGDLVRVNNKVRLNLPFNKNEIESRIKEALGQNGTNKYHIMMNNCEHFATYIRYGIPFSDQIESLLKIAKDITHPLRIMLYQAFGGQD